MTRKIVSRQTPEEQGHEKLDANRLCHDRRHSGDDKNKAAEYNLCHDIIKVCHDTIQEQAQRIGCDRIQEAATKAATKIESSVTISLFMSRQRD